MTKTNRFAVGTKVYYTGDMANTSGFGSVASIDGSHLNIRMDDGRYMAMVPALMFTAMPGQRFYTVADLEAKQQVAR